MNDKCDICIHTKYCHMKRDKINIDCSQYERKSADDLVDEMAVSIAYLNRRRDELTELQKTVKMLESDVTESIMFIQSFPDGKDLLERISKRIKVKV